MCIRDSLQRLTGQDRLSLRISADADAMHPGGLNLFGRHFGDYDQNIRVLFYYQEPEKPETSSAAD